MKKLLIMMLLVSMFAPTQILPGQTLDYYVYFPVDGHQISETEKQTLDKLITQAKKTGYYEMKLDAHTDNDGSLNYNMNLSERRAASVRKHLVSKGLAGTIQMLVNADTHDFDQRFANSQQVKCHQLMSVFFTTSP